MRRCWAWWGVGLVPGPGSGSRLWGEPTLQFFWREAKPQSTRDRTADGALRTKLKQNESQTLVTCTGTAEEPRGGRLTENTWTSAYRNSS